MTEQIVIKLNKKKFKPLLDSLIKKGGDLSVSYSECVGKCLFFLYLFSSEKNPRLDYMTQYEYLLERTKSTHEVTLLSFLMRYKKFLSTDFFKFKW